MEGRSVENAVEVPGTPEQVWAAIATGPGTEAWFVPAEIGGRVGGRVAIDVGTGMQDTGVVTVWEPPHRFAYEEEWEGIGTLATEFLVEARAGGTCVVRLVSSLSADGWQDELDGLRAGWESYLHNLALHLTHFAGQRCSTMMVTATAPGPRERVWEALTGALGLSAAAEGGRAATGDGAPALAGVVERVNDGEIMLRLDAPAPGTAYVHVYAGGDRVYANVHAYLYGAEAPAVCARNAPLWRAWMEENV